MNGGKLSQEKRDGIREQVAALAKSGNQEAIWQAVVPLLKAQNRDRVSAKALLEIIDLDYLTIEHARKALEAVASSYSNDIELISLIGENLDRAFDISFLNAPPPDHPLLPQTIAFLEKAWRSGKHSDRETEILDGLATAARLYGRQKDELAELAYKRLIELEPDVHFRHYNYGLFLKTRGRFDEGLAANSTAASLAANSSEATQWNIGICATGAGKGEVALGVWKQLGQKVKLGRFDLPEGRYPSCKVRLAERPLAERTAETDDPGEEETIWIERLSACHGIIRSVLYADLGVDYGDVVMFDGAPITHHKYDDVEVPVFPHLATLIRRNYHFFDFAGTQDQPRRLADVNEALEGDAILYSHTDDYITLCANCWNNPNTNHARHEEVTKHVVTGRIAAPPDLHPRELLAQLDAGIRELAPCQVYAPDLCRAAGQTDRAQVEQRRFDLLRNN
jgi:tetratricopeptide (TPR) repeat protein